MKTCLRRALASRPFTIPRDPQIAIRAFICCAISIAFCSAARSQLATGPFNGHVFDQNGAAWRNRDPKRCGEQFEPNRQKPTVKVCINFPSFRPERTRSPSRKAVFRQRQAPYSSSM